MTRDDARLSPARLDELIAAWRDAPVVVLGDVMSDRYLWGRVARVSPEAPVPVVEVSAETTCLGGAANVARTVAALGARPRLVGVVGEDAAGEALLAELRAADLDTRGVGVDPSRPTTVKTRVIAHNQHVVRADRESCAPLAPPVAARLLAALHAALAGARGLVISDYAKGVVSPDVLAAVLAAAAGSGILVSVDPKEAALLALGGADLVSVNEARAALIAGEPVTDATAEPIARSLRERIGCAAVLLTRGPRGMCLVDGDGPAARIATLARAVYDVTGAGDTVVGAAAVARVGGATHREAAAIANQAAGLVVAEVGTAAPALERLLAACEGARTPSPEGAHQGPLEEFFSRVPGPVRGHV